jgi:asparagine N-glycosylation enzyme membrane subunit Stt3
MRIVNIALAVIFILFGVLLTIAAVETVIPRSNGRLNLIGYRTCCPFTPISTAIGIAIALILFVAAIRMLNS